MVIGNGMIAKAFESYRDQDDYVIFASGVSDSTNADAADFARELKLVSETIKTSEGKLFVYFSTCSIYDPLMQDSAYVQHKLNVEDLITDQPAFIIFRLTNPVGSTRNTKTVVNHFIKHILERTEFTVWKNAARNIIDMDDVYLVCNEILQKRTIFNAIINIANPKNYPVIFIIEAIEKHFGIKGNYTLHDKGSEPIIDTSVIEPLFTEFNINFDEYYLPELLQKYFPK